MVGGALSHVVLLPELTTTKHLELTRFKKQNTGNLIVMCFLSCQGHYDYGYGYKSYDGKDSPYGQKFSNTVTYYYDNMSSNDLYSVDHDVLKDYIKRQM